MSVKESRNQHFEPVVIRSNSDGGNDVLNPDGATTQFYGVCARDDDGIVWRMRGACDVAWSRKRGEILISVPDIEMSRMPLPAVISGANGVRRAPDLGRLMIFGQVLPDGKVTGATCFLGGLSLDGTFTGQVPLSDASGLRGSFRATDGAGLMAVGAICPTAADAGQESCLTSSADGFLATA